MWHCCPCGIHSEIWYYSNELNDAIWQAYDQRAVIKFILPTHPGPFFSHCIDFTGASYPPETQIFFQENETTKYRRKVFLSIHHLRQPAPAGLVDSWPFKSTDGRGFVFSSSNVEGNDLWGGFNTPAKPMDYSSLINQLRLGLDGEDDFYTTIDPSNYRSLSIRGPEGRIEPHFEIDGESKHTALPTCTKSV